MLYAFGFERVGVLVGDLYSVNPRPRPGQEGAERGVRLELRVLERGALKGSIYSAQPIEIGQPIWRADFLETVAGPPGSFDRAHHHPAFRGWIPAAGSSPPGCPLTRLAGWPAARRPGRPGGHGRIPTRSGRP